MDPGAHDLNLLAALAENRLGPDERARVVAHLSACEDCRATFGGYVKAARATEAPARQSKVFGLPAWLPIAATVVLAVTAAIISVQLRPDVPEPGATPPLTVPTPTHPNVPDPSTQPAAPPRTGSTTPQPPRLRSGERKIGDKVFRLVAGEWIDEAYDPLSGLPVVDAATPQSRVSLLERVPALKIYSTLGDRVVVVHDGTVYRLGAPPR